MGVVVRRYIDILTIIINFPYSTCISSFFSSSIPVLCSFFKCFFGLVIYKGIHVQGNYRTVIRTLITYIYNYN